MIDIVPESLENHWNMKIEAGRFLKITERFAKENPGLEVRTIFFGYRAKRAAQEVVTAAGAQMIFTHGKIV